MSAKSIGKTAFLGVAWPPDAKPTPPGAAGSTVDQNWAKTLPREAVWSIGGVEIGESKRKFRFRLVQDAPLADEAVYHALVDCHVAFASLERAARVARTRRLNWMNKGLTPQGIARLE